jgi:hypothetical protein
VVDSAFEPRLAAYLLAGSANPGPEPEPEAPGEDAARPSILARAVALLDPPAGRGARGARARGRGLNQPVTFHNRIKASGYGQAARPGPKMAKARGGGRERPGLDADAGARRRYPMDCELGVFKPAAAGLLWPSAVWPTGRVA